MEKAHKDLLAGIAKLRESAMQMIKKGCRLEGVVHDLDEAAAKITTRLAYYKAGKQKKPVEPEEKKA